MPTNQAMLDLISANTGATPAKVARAIERLNANICPHCKHSTQTVKPVEVGDIVQCPHCGALWGITELPAQTFAEWQRQ